MKSLLFKTSLLAAVALLPALLGACDDRRLITYATWKQTEAFEEPQAMVQQLSHTVRFKANSSELTAAEKAALLQFLERQSIQPGTKVVLRSETANETEAATVSDRLAALRRVLAGRSLDVEMAPPNPTGKAEDVSVVAYKMAVTPIACEGYNAPIRLDEEWRPVWNMGCYNAVNLGLMLENPADLAGGRPLPPADGDGQTLSIQRYRTGQTYPPINEDTTQ
jgi:pilus biogenesis lipoprotein CpaD